MKKILSILVVLSFLVSGVYASGFSKKGKAGAIKVEISSEKPLVSGNNEFKIELKKAGKAVNNAKVKMQIFMPEMPGMPYMEYEDIASFKKDGEYKVKINFGMGGTWQVRIFIESEGKKYRYKSSVIIWES